MAYVSACLAPLKAVTFPGLFLRVSWAVAAFAMASLLVPLGASCLRAFAVWLDGFGMDLVKLASYSFIEGFSETTSLQWPPLQAKKHGCLVLCCTSTRCLVLGGLVACSFSAEGSVLSV